MGQVLGDGQHPIYARMLKDDADSPAQRGTVHREVIPENADLARLKRHERREQLEQRRFAPAVRAEQTEDFAARDREIHLMQRRPLTIFEADTRRLDCGNRCDSSHSRDGGRRSWR